LPLLDIKNLFRMLCVYNVLGINGIIQEEGKTFKWLASRNSLTRNSCMRLPTTNQHEIIYAALTMIF